MKVLVTNDDGVHSQGIIQLAKLVRSHCDEVFLVAPRVEQSGVSQAITFLSPLFPHALGWGFGTPRMIIFLAIRLTERLWIASN